VSTRPTAATHVIAPASINARSGGSKSRAPIRITFARFRSSPSPASHHPAAQVNTRPPRYPLVDVLGVFTVTLCIEPHDGRVRATQGNNGKRSERRCTATLRGNQLDARVSEQPIKVARQFAQRWRSRCQLLAPQSRHRRIGGAQTCRLESQPPCQGVAHEPGTTMPAHFDLPCERRTRPCRGLAAAHFPVPP
jgi:hypothetical protein